MSAPLDRLRPVVRTSAELAPTLGPDTYVRRPAGMLLVEALRINDAYEPRLVTHDDVAQWGVGVDELFARARENLADERRAFLMEPTELGSSVVRNAQPTGNATTWAMNPAFVRGMMPPHPSRPGPDDPLVFIPEPGTMFIARSSAPAEIKAALGTARQVYAASSEKTAPCAFEYTADGLLEPWLPGADADPALSAQAQQARADFIVAVYGDAVDRYTDTPEGRKHVKQQGLAFNRPTLFDPAKPEIELRQATWQPSRTVLAPAYAAIRFVPNKADAVTVGLADLAGRAPELIGGFRLDPSWVVVAAFPNAEQLEKLRG